MKLSEQDCRDLQLWLAVKLSRFAIPILLASDEFVRAEGLVNGSGCLIQVGGAPHLLTCLHVLEQLAKLGDRAAMVIALGDGFEAVRLKKPRLVASNSELDLAVVDLEGVGQLTQKSWFILDAEAVHVPSKGEILIVLGFPGMWRASAENQSHFPFSPLPFVVGDVTPRSIAIAEQGKNQEVFHYLDSDGSNNCVQDALGGLSGAGAFFITPNQEIKLAGIVSSRACGFLNLTRISAVLDLLAVGSSVSR